MVKYRVNFDYELELFDGIYSKYCPSDNINKQFEYIFLFMESSQNTLCSSQKYESSYLEYIENLKNDLLPAILDCSYEKNWWGSLTDIKLEKKINSKITSTQLAIEKGWAHDETCIVSSITEIKKNILQSRYSEWFIKNPYLFSGQGFVRVTRENIKEKKLIDQIEKLLSCTPAILDPVLNRIRDYGISWNFEKNFVIENFITARGGFKGGLVYKNTEHLCSIQEQSRIIFDAYYKLGARGSIEFDAFEYFEDGKVKIYKLVEVNYRKTMGSFIDYMSRFLPRDGVGAWLIFSAKNLKEQRNFLDLKKSLGAQIYDSKTKIGVIPCSPTDLAFASFFISDKSLRDLQFATKKLWDSLRAGDRPLAKEFIFNY